MLPPSDEPSDGEEESGGVAKTEYPLDAMLTDLAHFYHRSIAEIVATPRRFRRMMLDNVARITAQNQILDTAVAMYPHISGEDRTQQMGIWKKLAKIVGFIGSAIEQVIWEGSLPEDMPANMIVAEDWDTVEAFFTSSKGDLPGLLTQG